MKKTICGVLLSLAFLPRFAHAQATEMALSSATICAPVSVSSSAPTAMLTNLRSTATPVGLQQIISIYNLSTSSYVSCGNVVNVSTIPGNANIGWPLNIFPVKVGTIAQPFWTWTLLATQQFYCLAADITNLTTQVQLCRNQ